mmetsp:Transcript_9413/g.15282  ORF Transcript_9413/g.15282 Transcript_9413/m.15282 type:complete len:476 (+) Transcript_9413:154-1581(+)
MSRTVADNVKLGYYHNGINDFGGAVLSGGQTVDWDEELQDLEEKYGPLKFGDYDGEGGTQEIIVEEEEEDGEDEGKILHLVSSSPEPSVATSDAQQVRLDLEAQMNAMIKDMGQLKIRNNVLARTLEYAEVELEDIRKARREEALKRRKNRTVKPKAETNPIEITGGEKNILSDQRRTIESLDLRVRGQRKTIRALQDKLALKTQQAAVSAEKAEHLAATNINLRAQIRHLRSKLANEQKKMKDVAAATTNTNTTHSKVDVTSGKEQACGKIKSKSSVDNAKLKRTTTKMVAAAQMEELAYLKRTLKEVRQNASAAWKADTRTKKQLRDLREEMQDLKAELSLREKQVESGKAAEATVEKLTTEIKEQAATVASFQQQIVASDNRYKELREVYEDLNSRFLESQGAQRASKAARKKLADSLRLYDQKLASMDHLNRRICRSLGIEMESLHKGLLQAASRARKEAEVLGISSPSSL